VDPNLQDLRETSNTMNWNLLVRMSRLVDNFTQGLSLDRFSSSWLVHYEIMKKVYYMASAL
jgi:hypothetical protein